MTQKDKELLLRDLCARLPYGVVIQEKCLEHDETFFPYAENNKVVNIDVHEDLVITGGGSWYYIEDIKPYLFPMLSMTEEQKSFFENKHIEADDYLGIIAPFSLVDCEEWDEVFCWLNKNHFDYRGLIPIGLAIDATNLNIY